MASLNTVHVSAGIDATNQGPCFKHLYMPVTEMGVGTCRRRLRWKMAGAGDIQMVITKGLHTIASVLRFRGEVGIPPQFMKKSE